MEQAAGIFLQGSGDLPGHSALQRAGNETQTNDDRGFLLADFQGFRGGIELLHHCIHPLLKEAALLCQTDVAAHLFEQLHTQLVFQIPDGAAQGRLGDFQPGSSQGIVFQLRQHGEIAQMIVIHTCRSNL